ncbi:cyclic AMP receptor-like protein A isoform X1 [Ylistrum balloti]|uniref:cyclic AMP receptor-like protein A isoform X1 n=1 Tax=Ylistrum balloti TaxID=509963 RepID=UPI002905DCD2|nr:cyclic AMP receptor-like protein A isoform X1 [Ylistrum balloti]
MNSTSDSDCPIFPDQPGHCDVLIAIRRTTGALSLVGCIFMISVIWLFKKYAAFSQRLIMYLSIGALLNSISYLMGGLRPDGPLCDFQAWWMTFFDWTVLLWVCCITFNLYLNVIKMITKESLEWVYHVLCWGLPLVLSCLPFIGNHYGPAGAWCWIEDNWHWRVGIWYGPLFLTIFCLFVVYIYITYILTRKASSWQGTYDPDTEHHKELMKEDIKPLRAYPCIYLAVSIFPLINRIQNAISPEYPVFPLMVLSALSSPIQGAVNAIVFGLDRETFSRLTPSQMKMAFLSHNQAPRVREYPVALYSQDTLSSPLTAEPPQPRFSNVSYSRLT